MDSQEDYEAYLRWCEERRMAIQEQEQQQALLREITERAEEKKREMEREKAAKEMKVSMERRWCQNEKKKKKNMVNRLVSYLVSWCFEPGQPQRITSGLKTNFSLSPSYTLNKL